MNVGITGHQRLPDAAQWTWVARVMDDELASFPSPLVIVTSLAIGADQLLARLAYARGALVRAILPFEGIERTFSAEGLASYRDVVARASVEILPTQATDQDGYLAAGKRVVDLSDVLFAVWNGLPAKGKGGTADAYSYAVSRGVPVVHFNPTNLTVTRIGRRP